ncbi:PfkB family carbohydrate kinase [Pseudoalteromonas sp. B193]
MWVIFSEIFPTRICGVAIPTFAFIASVVSYLVQQFFPWQLNNFGAANIFLFYSISGVIGFVLLYKIMPETKNKSIEEIEEQLAGVSAKKVLEGVSTLLAIGECMVELVPQGISECKQSFAGDTYNALVYAKRFAQQLNCELFTAVGEDVLSVNMLKKWQQEGISAQQVIKTATHNVGIYAISTDQQGERSFDYWRNQLLLNI